MNFRNEDEKLLERFVPKLKQIFEKTNDMFTFWIFINEISF